MLAVYRIDYRWCYKTEGTDFLCIDCDKERNRWN